MADFDRDGSQDIAVATYDGLYTANESRHLFTQVSQGPYRNVIASDLDADGNPDLATVSIRPGGTKALHVRFGDGTGSFEPAVLALVFDDNPAYRDASRNLVAFAPLASGAPSEQSIALLTASGIAIVHASRTRELTASFVESPLEYVTSIAVADLDGDGLNDIVVGDAGYHCIWVADCGSATRAGALAWLRAANDGTFRDEILEPSILDDGGSQGGVIAVTVAPATTTSSARLIVSKFLAPSEVVYLSAAGMPIIEPFGPERIDMYADTRIMDVDRDGVVDLIEATSGSPGMLRLSLGRSVEAFDSPTSLVLHAGDYGGGDLAVTQLEAYDRDAGNGEVAVALAYVNSSGQLEYGVQFVNPACLIVSE